MGNYISYDDLVARYDIIRSWGNSASVIDASLIVYAEAELNQRLAKNFTIPFNPVPLSIKDICIDLTYGKSLRGKDPDKAEVILKDVADRIALMHDYGIVTDSGTLINPASPEQEIYSTTMNYLPAHTMLPADNEYTNVDSSQQYDLEQERIIR